MGHCDRAVFRAALRENADDLRRYLERRVANREDAADLLGETMLQAWRRAEALPLGDATRQRMWLFTVASNVLRNHQRSQRRRLALADRLREQLRSRPPATENSEGPIVREIVLSLPDTHKELVMLIHWDGFTPGEAAELLDINPSTARSRYAAAKDSIRQALLDHKLVQ